MFSYLYQYLSPRRREKALFVGTLATVILYGFFTLIAEPLRLFAARLVSSIV
jgi:hypothetical protein